MEQNPLDPLERFKAISPAEYKAEREGAAKPPAPDLDLGKENAAVETPKTRTPEEEQKLQSQRGGYTSDISRRGEMEKEGKEWRVTDKGFETLVPKAKEEMERDLASRKTEEVVEAEAGKEVLDEELKNAYFEWQDLERKAKKSFADQHDSLWDAALAAKEKYHQLLIEKSGVTEKGKPFYLPEEMAPEGGPQKYNLERLEKVVAMELDLQKEYEKRASTESKEAPGIFKKLWHNYSKIPKSTRIALGVGIATGAFIFTGGAAGLWAVGAYGGAKLARSLVGGFVAGWAYKGLDKFVAPFVDRAAKKNIEKIKQEQAEILNDIRISGVQKELLFAKENMIREYARIARQKQRINIEKALIAGALGVGASFLAEPTYEYLSEKFSGGGAVSPESFGRGVPPAGSEVAGVPPIAGKTAEALADKYSKTISQGGNLWKATRGIAERMGMSNPDFNDAWRDSYVYIPEKEGVFHISEVDLVHPGAKVIYDPDSKIFMVEGERMGTARDLYDALVREGKPIPHRLEEMFGQKPSVVGAAEIPVETSPVRPFDQLPVEAPESPKAPTFTELEAGYPGADAEKFISERLASINVDSDYYEQIKNSKVKDLLKIRKGTFWDLFQHLNDETAGRVDIYSEWKLASLVKAELKNLLPFVEDKTIDEALKIAAQNRNLIK
ncbi:MAG: hypothetical protein AAB527_04120 [Patescibacteria group bacterium]